MKTHSNCYHAYHNRATTGNSGNLLASDLAVENFCRTCRRNRRGAAAVEFAIVAPVFFLLVFGMVEYGRMIMVQQVITNAARAGRAGAMLDPPGDSSSVTSTVNNYLSSAGIPTGLSSEVTPTFTAATSTAPGQVKVVINIPFSKVSWLPHPWFLGSYNMSATSVMLWETSISN